ncbi:hypothetical protein SLS56_007651 [Neofusicoccum ribis]|uniref:Uncharacterized protein n=1 Tax=Neofusicoccum ribis TaxID=45134 RepID=A0ABR3SMY6_9PEZI
MFGRRHALLALFALLALLSTALAASPASFCKCTCFTNSTIIHLDDPSPYSKSGSSKSDSSKSSGSSLLFSSRANDGKKTSKRTCNDCNKKFCMEYNLPICHGAKEEDVYTECFQRDSAKDQAVVVIFITATVSLLIYAAARPYVDRWSEVSLV